MLKAQYLVQGRAVEIAEEGLPNPLLGVILRTEQPAVSGGPKLFVILVVAPADPDEPDTEGERHAWRQRI